MAGEAQRLCQHWKKKGEMCDTLRENITFLKSVINKLVNLYLNDHHIVIEEKKLAMRM